MILNESVDRKIIPVAGGKGGVGKSVIATNLALSLALFNKKVVLVDLDLGGSNIHTILGIRNINPGISHFLSRKSYSSLAKLVLPTQWDNLSFIPGDTLSYGVGEITPARKKKVIQGLLELDTDYIIVDLGAGVHSLVIDFFLISNSGLIVTVPQITSIMNSYVFLKNYVFRFLQRAFAGNEDVTRYLKKSLKTLQRDSSNTVTGVLAGMRKIDPQAADKAESFLDVLQPKLILNKMRGSADMSLAEGLRDLCRRNLNTELECLGTIMLDSRIDNSIDIQEPYILDLPDEVVTKEIHRVSQKIIQSKRFPVMPLELKYYSDSFELAHIEAENDINIQRDNLQESEPNDSHHDIAQMLELISAQQQKIRELQGTVRMLTINKG